MRWRVAWGKGLLLISLSAIVASCLGPSLHQVAESVPVYPGAMQVGTAVSGPPDGDPSVSIAYQAPAEARPEDVVAWYEQRLTEEGWRLEKPAQAVSANVPASLLFRREEWQVQVLIIGESASYQIHIVVRSSP